MVKEHRNYHGKYFLTLVFASILLFSSGILVQNVFAIEPLSNDTVHVSASTSVPGTQVFDNGTIITSIGGVPMKFFFDPNGPLKSTSTQSPTSSVISRSIQAPTGSTISINVNSVDLSGNQITGLYIELQNSNGVDQATGFTPVTFSAVSGQQYIVYPNN